ncbi:MAG TPA: phosphatase PAP2 family protein [Aquihabitans sp.]|nr:phosphatase PAP2 family protein [Aquihabitans sp.]
MLLSASTSGRVDQSWLLWPSGLVSSIGGAPVRLAVLAVALVALLATGRRRAAFFAFAVVAVVHAANRVVKGVAMAPRLPNPHRAYALAPSVRSGLILCVLITGLLLLGRRWRPALWVVPTGYLVLVGVDRAVRHIPVTSGQDSLPSGHAANSMAMAMALVLVTDGAAGLARSRLVALGAVAAAALVGLSRVTLGYHRPGEVAAGWLLAALATFLIWSVVRPDRSSAAPT